MHNFKVGQRVRCTGESRSFGENKRVIKGNIYTIIHVRVDSYNDTYLGFVQGDYEIPFGWIADKFKLASVKKYNTKAIKIMREG